MENPQSTVTNQTVEAENARLRARIRELESESSDTDFKSSSRRPRTRRTRALSEETEDYVRDIPSHAFDELSRFGRGLSNAMSESFRTASDVINSFGDELFGQRSERRPRRSSSPRQAESEAEPEVVSNVVDDVVAGVSGGMHELIDAPRRVVESFMDAYQEESKSSTEESNVRSRTAEDKGRRTRSKVKEEKEPPTA